MNRMNKTEEYESEVLRAAIALKYLRGSSRFSKIMIMPSEGNAEFTEDLEIVFKIATTHDLPTPFDKDEGIKPVNNTAKPKQDTKSEKKCKCLSEIEDHEKILVYLSESILDHEGRIDDVESKLNKIYKMLVDLAKGGE